MRPVKVTRDDFLQDRQGKTFSDVLNDSAQPFDEVLQFLNDANRQRRMEEAEIHHDRSPLAGVVRELESLPAVDKFLSRPDIRRNTRFRQAIGVLVRMIMERRGWRKTGRKGSLGVRAAQVSQKPAHNTGGLALWFVRAERYERPEGMPYRSVTERCQALEGTSPRKTKPAAKRQARRTPG